MNDPRDLKHRDWLLFSTKEMLQEVDENISIEIVDRKDGGKVLVASGVSEKSIDKLVFLTNTDQNNNYLYLEDFEVYIFGAYSPLNIPGLKETVMNVFRANDISGFLEGNKTHDPFNPKHFSKTTFKGTTFSEYVDDFSGLVPYCTHTLGKIKTYNFVLNPDLAILESQPQPINGVRRISKQVTNTI